MAVTEIIAPRKHNIVTTMLLVFVFWVIAALLVTVAHQTLARVSPAICVGAKVMAILATALGYMRLAARRAALNDALAVGVVWLVLVIFAEVITSARTNAAWFELLGPPDSALRNVLMIAWVVAPALFAKHGE